MATESEQESNENWTDQELHLAALLFQGIADPIWVQNMNKVESAFRGLLQVVRKVRGEGAGNDPDQSPKKKLKTYTMEQKRALGL